MPRAHDRQMATYSGTDTTLGLALLYPVTSV
jgi:hypothetical protein